MPKIGRGLKAPRATNSLGHSPGPGYNPLSWVCSRTSRRRPGTWPGSWWPCGRIANSNRSCPTGSSCSGRVVAIYLGNLIFQVKTGIAGYRVVGRLKEARLVQAGADTAIISTSVLGITPAVLDVYNLV